MNNFIDNIKRTFGQPRLPAQHLTRAQARKLILESIDPLLKREGFAHRKGNNLWRITENKTDVIELRFLTLEEHQQFKIPESTFSINYGCYYHFIPDIHDGKYLHELPDLITPQEVYCHYRMRTSRSIQQKPKKMDLKAWHLDEPEERQRLVLNDLVAQFEKEIFPTLNRLNDINQWLQELESSKFNLGIGGANSKEFLLGFTYKHLKNEEKARAALIKAKKLSEEYNKKFAEISKNFAPSAPIFYQLEIINRALGDLQ